MDTPTFFLTRAARMILEVSAKEKENELLNTLRFADLPKVGNSQTQGGRKMGSLTKLAESQEEKSTGLFVKKAEKEDSEEYQYTSADRIKIAAAHLTNFIAAAKEDGMQIKEASSKEEIDPNLILKTAQLYVIDSYDLYKEAGISREGLMQLLDILKRAPSNLGKQVGVLTHKSESIKPLEQLMANLRGLGGMYKKAPGAQATAGALGALGLGGAAYGAKEGIEAL